MEQPKYNEDLLTLLGEWYDSPLRFVRECIGVEPSDQQLEALEALQFEVVPKGGTKRLTIKAGHGPGKDALVAWCIIWFLTTRSYPKVPCTAPTARQLSSILWAEVSKWLRKSLVSDLFEIQKEKIYRIGAKDEWFAIAMTASVSASADAQADTLSGQHGDHVLVIVDEASGVPDPVFIPLEGIMTAEDNIVIMISNPTKLSGYFYETHCDPKISAMWTKRTWSSVDSSNVARTFIETMKSKYGEDSNIYRVRVLGEFPLRDSDAYIPYELADAATHREIESQVEFPYVFSVDVGRGGDDSVILMRQGDNFLPYEQLRNKDTMETVKRVAELANIHKPADIRVDVIGIGAGVYDRLKEMGYPVTPINVAETPAVHPERFRRLRDELWGQALTYLEKRTCKIWDNEEQELVGELTSIRYSTDDKSGKLVIESKKDMKKRGLQSPNIADAFVMHFYMPTMRYTKELEFFQRFNGIQEDVYQPLDVEAGV